jgi:hypothetical protein
MSRANGTKIAFKFLRPGGLALTDRGRFNPNMVTKYKQIPGGHGRMPYHDYDFDEVFTISLESETPRPLPAFLTDPAYGDDMRHAYMLKQVEAIQSAHDSNNLIRDEIDYYVSTGLIEKVSDSFYDALAAKAAETVDSVIASLDAPEEPGAPATPDEPKADAKNKTNKK